MSDIFVNRGKVNITEDEAKRELGLSFVRTVEHIKNIADANDCFCLIHGTTMEKCLEIIRDERGLMHYNNEYSSTMSSFSNFSNLYNCGLVNGILPDGFIILLIPKGCFFKDSSYGLWHSLVNSNDDSDVILDDDCDILDIEKYSIPHEYIFGFIDLANKQIVQNQHFNSKYRNPKLILDSHTFGSVKVIREQDFSNEKVRH